MNRVQQVLLLIAFLLAAAFDVVLLRQLSSTRELNGILRARMTLSLDQQLTLSEHAFEGTDLTKMLKELPSAGNGPSLRGSGDAKLIYYFPNRSSCRRALHDEVGVLQGNRDGLSERGIDVLVVFGHAINQLDFDTMVRQYDIADISVLDTDGVVQRHLGRQIGAMAVAVDESHRVLFAQFPRTSSEGGTRELYRKLGIGTVDEERST